MLQLEVQDPARMQNEQGSVIQRMASLVFLWTRLHAPGKTSPGRTLFRINFFHASLMFGFVCFGALLLYTYLFLYLSSMSRAVPTGDFFVPTDPHPLPRKWVFDRMKPIVGKHISLLVIVRDVIVWILYYVLCTYLMQPLVGVEHYKEEEIGLARPWGCFHSLSQLRRLCGAGPQTERWFTTFLADHLYLFVCGFFNVMYKIEIYLHKSNAAEVSGTDPSRFHEMYRTQLLGIRCVTSIYTTILTTMFLVTTLEYNIVPVLRRQSMFRVTVFFLWILLLTEFILMIDNRSQYSAYFSKPSVVNRVSGAMAQVFASHCLVMMGAVLAGHSGHFHRSPDLTWGTFWFKLMPILVLVAGVLPCLMGLVNQFRGWYDVYRDWTFLGNITVYAVELSVFALFVASMILLYMARANEQDAMKRSHHSHANEAVVSSSCSIKPRDSIASARESMASDASEVWNDDAGGKSNEGDADFGSQLNFYELIDYDIVIAMITASFGLLYNVTLFWNSTPPSKSCGWHLLTLLTHIAILAFTLCVWRHPPFPGSLAHSGVWVAWFLAVAMFILFQFQEDCHFSSSLPQCCHWPDVAHWDGENNTAYEDHHHWCDKVHRCHNARYSLPVSNSNSEEFNRFTLFCSVGKPKSDTDSKLHPFRHNEPNKDICELDPEHTPDFREDDLGHCCCCNSGSLVAKFPWLKKLEVQIAQATSYCSTDIWDDVKKKGETPCMHNSKHGKGGERHLGAGRTDTNFSCDEDTKDGPVYHRRLGGGHTDISETCAEELKCRWALYEALGEPQEDIDDFESGESFTFILFESIGLAMIVEMYFTLSGILLKVIFLTQHPNSEKILELETLHHSAHEGEDKVISANKATKRWRKAICLVRPPGVS